MPNNPYYLAYEERYSAVYAAGADRWGHAPDDPLLGAYLAAWVQEYGLQSKRVVEFACGEGASGVILSRLGCAYHGVDIAPSAVEKARATVAEFPQATVSQMDMVREHLSNKYDAALDCMGFHMLITDGDRQAYLKNALAVLNPGAPMLFYCECYDPEAHEGPVPTYDAWLSISGGDYTTPQLRRVMGSGMEVQIPLVPARSRSRDGYIEELTEAGFIVDGLKVMAPNSQNPFAATIWARKPS